MNMLQPYLSDTLVQALGWTFLHSLWIGALLCAVFLAVKWIIKGFSANARYTTGLVFLSLMPAIMAIVFIFVFNETSKVSPEAVGQFQPLEEVAAGKLVVTAGSKAPVLQEPFYSGWVTEAKAYYFVKYHSFFVALWMVGVLLLSIQNIGGYFYTGRLRRHGLMEPASPLRETFSALLRTSGVTRTVLLMESLLVRAPLLVGYFKPVILLPIGLASSLSMQEVEAILAHEIAHIRRHDFLVNILQCCIEVLFFYHPAVWIIGSAIRNERENCCDDVAISLSGSSMSLAMALSHVEEWKLNGNLALGFSGNKHSLLNRIKRIINNKTMKAQHREGNLLAIAIIAGLCLSTLTALSGIDYEMIQEKPLKKEKIVEPTEAAPVQEMQEPLAVKAAEPTPTAEPKVRQAVKVSEAAPVIAQTDSTSKSRKTPLPAIAPLPAWSSADVLVTLPPIAPIGAIMSADSPDLYSLVAPRAMWSYSGSADNAWAAVAGVDTVIWEAAAPDNPEEFAAHMQDMAREMAHMQEHMAKEMPERAAEMSKAAAHMALHQQEMASGMAKQQQHMAEEMAERHQEMAEKHALMAEEFGQRNQEEMMKHQEEMLREQKKMLAIQETEMKKMEAEMRNHEEKMKVFEKDLKAELTQDGPISSRDDHFKLRINGKELTINGEKQPEKVYSKYRKFIREKLGESYSFEADGDEEMNLSFSF